MENLIRELMDKHNINQEEAKSAINLVIDYLKEQSPVLEQLIDAAIQDGQQQSDV